MQECGTRLNHTSRDMTEIVCAETHLRVDRPLLCQIRPQKKRPIRHAKHTDMYPASR